MSDPYFFLINPDVERSNSLSLGYVAAYVRQNGFEADILDFGSSPLSLTSFCDLLRYRQPTLVGISAYQTTMEKVVYLSNMIKEYCHAKIIIGGPQACGMPDKGFSQLPNVDFLCRGEGELIATSLLQAFQKKQDIGKIPGISLKLPDGFIQTNENPSFPTDLDEYPSPFLNHILPITFEQPVGVLSSRGCVFNCSFCMTPFLSGRKVRFHSIDRVIQELLYVHAHGATNIGFADPLFFVNKERMQTLFHRILDLKKNFRIWCETRAELVDKEMLELMHEAGVTEMSVGLESTSDKTLALMGKHQTTDDIAKLYRNAKKFGITVNLMHIVGAPGDTLTSILSTFDYVRNLGNLMGPNNKGNRYSVYFGTRDYFELGKNNINLNHIAQKKNYPSYLSPGTNVHSKDLSKNDYEKIFKRQDSEHDLATLVNAVKSLSITCGISQQEALKFSARNIVKVRDVFHPNAVRNWNDKNIPLDCVVMDGRKARNSDVCMDLVEKMFDQLTFNGFVFLLGNSEIFMGNKQFISVLEKKFSLPTFKNVTMVFTLSPQFWRDHHTTLFRYIKRLRQTHHFPGEVKKKQWLLHLIGLLEISNQWDISLEELVEIQQAITKLGIMTLPFVAFDSPTSLTKWVSWLYVQKNKKTLQQQIFVGSALRNFVKELNHLYKNSQNHNGLPPLVMTDGCVFVPGGSRTKKRINDPLPEIHCAWIDMTFPNIAKQNQERSDHRRLVF